MAYLPGSPLRPRWVYNDGAAVDYLMGVPQQPWNFGSRGIGGSDTSAAGVPAAYEIRRDYLLHLTLLFPESEWDDVARLVRHLQRAGSATLYPDQDDPSVSHTVYGDAPAIGEEIRPRRSDFLSVLELDITVRRTTASIFTDRYMGDLLFYWRAGTRVDGMVFTRSGIAYYVDRDGVLRTTATDVERTEWTGAGFGTPEALLEDARTNLLTRSEEIDDAAWGKTRLTVTANDITAPDGTATADKVVDDSTASQTHYIRQSLAKATSSLEYALTLYARAAEHSRMQIRITGASGGDRVIAAVDLAAGTIGSPSAQGSGWTAGSSRITAFPDRWYRVEITGTSDASATVRVQVMIDNGSGITYDGDGSSGLHMWGLQLEQAAFASSYIQTVGSALQRNAETMHFPFPWPAQAITLYVDSVFLGSSGRLLHLGRNDNKATKPHLYMDSAAGDLHRLSHHNGTTLVTATLGAAPAIGDRVKSRGVLHEDGSVLIGQSINGAAETTAISGANALGGDWAAAFVTVNGPSSDTHGINRFSSVKIARGVKTAAAMEALQV